MTRITHLVITLAVAAGFALAPMSLAAEDGETLYKTKTCMACHGMDGKTPLMPEYPKIAGQNAAYAKQQMLDIKSGARANAMSAAMKGVMYMVSDEQITILAEYLEQLPAQ